MFCPFRYRAHTSHWTSIEPVSSVKNLLYYLCKQFHLKCYRGRFPLWYSGKESTFQRRAPGFDPWLGNWEPTCCQLTKPSHHNYFFLTETIWLFFFNSFILSNNYFNSVKCNNFALKNTSQGSSKKLLSSELAYLSLHPSYSLFVAWRDWHGCSIRKGPGNKVDSMIEHMKSVCLHWKYCVVLLVILPERQWSQKQSGKKRIKKKMPSLTAWND